MTASHRTASSANQAYNFIRAQILSGAYGEGMRLTETQISDHLGLSRTPVREAMRLLVSDGFLHFQPNSGTFVRTWDAAEVAAVYDARLLVESELAALAARRITPYQLDRMRAIHEQIELQGADTSEENQVRIEPLNREFHAVIIDSANNPRMAVMREQALEIQIIRRTQRRYTPIQLARSFQHHRELLDALSCNDSDWARDIMACHLRSAKLAMLGRQEKE